MDQDSLKYVLIGVTAVVGFAATAIYYFARYYFRTHDGDQEVVKGLREPEGETLFRESGTAVPEPEKVTIPEAGEVLSDEVEAVVTSKKEEAPSSAAEAAPTPSTPVAPTPVERKADLQSALANTRSNIFGRIKSVFSSEKAMSDDDMESLEEILYTSDLGPMTVQRLIEAVGEKLHSGDKADAAKVKEAIRDEMNNIFSSLEGLPTSDDWQDVLKIDAVDGQPQVWMIVGVNGAGKTTTIGKLANGVASSGKKVLVAAGDTFRAAAGDQLRVWSERAQVEIFSPEGVTDPSAVAFDACSSAKAKGFDVVIIDTAGRLHTQDNLMEELKKMKRVIQKVLPDAPNEVFIVLDANSGQNALIQAKTFNEILDLTGAILTKLDGTAKGGVAVGLACELQLPIKLIGVGEGIEDIRSFQSKEYVNSII